MIGFLVWLALSLFLGIAICLGIYLEGKMDKDRRE